MDEYQRHALHRAVKANNGWLVSTLLRNNVDINYADSFGNTALHLAVSGRNFYIINLLLAKNPNVNVRSIFGYTPLLLAAYIGCFNTVEELIDRGADVRHKGKDGRTALHWNSIGEQDSKVVKLLLIHGAYVNAQDCQGRTALHLAAISHHYELISDLLEWGASMIIEDMNGIKPLDLAFKETITTYTFAAHVYMRSCLGLFDDTDNYSQQFIDVYWDIDWRFRCLEEANKIKTFRLRVSELFSKRFDPAFLNDREVRRSLMSFFLSTSAFEFPIYSSFIKVMFIKCEQRLSLLNTAQNLDLFRKNTPFPNEIIRKILSFLHDEDLRCVVTAGQEQL